MDLLTQRDPITNKPLYPPGKHIVWLDNLFTSVKLFKRLRGLGIGAAGTVRTTRTKREEMGDKAIDIEEVINENIEAPIETWILGKKMVPAEPFSARLMDLKQVYKTQIS